MKRKNLKKGYSDLFHLNPLPMWVYEIDTLKFADVNVAATQYYGYTREEFLNMTIQDIHTNEDKAKVQEVVKHNCNESKLYFPGIFRHVKKTVILLK